VQKTLIHSQVTAGGSIGFTMPGCCVVPVGATIMCIGFLITLCLILTQLHLMKPKFKAVFEMALEEGIRAGYYRAYKHNESPDVEDFVTHTAVGILNSLDDWFKFEGDDNV